MGEYELRESLREELPRIDVLESKDGVLVAKFGPGYYKNNVFEMKRFYFNSQKHSKLTFRPTTTAFSLDVLASRVPDFKRQILNLGWLQAGWIFKSSEGVYANPPLDKNGEPITDEKILKNYLNDAIITNGIYLFQNGKVESLRDFGFAPYDSFRTGEQDMGQFLYDGLARLLEHTGEKKAVNLGFIVKNYLPGVNVCGFESAEKGEVLPQVLSLNSGGGTLMGRLYVSGDGWNKDIPGCAFGEAVKVVA